MNGVQLEHWRGTFGDAYVDRNPASDDAVRARAMMWARILGAMSGDPPQRILEIGANVGINIRGLRQLTAADIYALEPNDSARRILADDGVVPADHLLEGCASDIRMPDRSVDLAFTCGVLIHINPDDLLATCQEIRRVSRKYILSIEYFSKNPVELEYRGQEKLLFKRDFGGYWLDNFSDLEIVDYGFFWNRATALDDLTWWLFRTG